MPFSGRGAGAELKTLSPSRSVPPGRAMNLIERIFLQTKDASGYCPDVGYLLSLISAWSYSETETLLKILKRDSVAGPSRSVEIEGHSVRNSALPVDVNAYVVTIGAGEVESPLTIVCFRGTELTNLIDLLTDALVEPHPWPNRRNPDEWVHRGFFLSLDVLWPELADDLRGRAGDLYFAGHSLGGAVAVLAGRRFSDDAIEGPRLRGVYSYGQPMVGGRAFSEAWPSSVPLYRHVNNQDLVVRLPPRLSNHESTAYKHFGEIYFPLPASSNGEAVPRWTRLHSGRDDAAMKDASDCCEGLDILPALLTLITTRAPSLPAEFLEVVANLPRAARWVPTAPLRLLRGQRVIPPSKFSLNDHAPTYYVEVAKNSRER